MNDRNITVKEIAKECGVSMMTVSRALDPRQGVSMRPETRQRIIEIVHKRGYVSNPAARRLKRQKVDVITLIMAPRAMLGPRGAPDFDAHHESISWGLVRGVIAEARKWNYDVKLECLLDYGLTSDVINHLKPEHTAGVIFNGKGTMEPIIDFVQKANIPFLIFGESIDLGNSLDYSEVHINRSPGFMQAVDYLFDKGHRQIGYIGCKKLNSSNHTFTLLRNFLEEKCIYNENLIYSVTNFFELRTLLASFNGKFPFTALFCLNDTAADMTVRELRFMGIKVPEQIAVVGLDRNPVYSGPGKTNPSTINTPFEELSSEATRTLIDIIERKTDKNQKFSKMIPTTFHQGETA